MTNFLCREAIRKEVKKMGRLEDEGIESGRQWNSEVGMRNSEGGEKKAENSKIKDRKQVLWKGLMTKFDYDCVI